MVEALRFIFPAFFGALIIGAILDWLGYLAYWPVFYSIGLRVFRDELPSLRPPLGAVGSFVDTTNGRFKVADGKVLMRQRWSLRTHDFTERGTIEWVNGSAVAVARTSLLVPVLAVLGVGLFVLGIVSGTWQGMVFGPMIALSYLLQVLNARKSLRRLLAEYEAWTRGDPSSA